MTKRFTLGLTALLTLSFSASALAADTANMPAVQSEIRSALSVLDLGIDSERVTFALRGRRDLTLNTMTDRSTVVANMKKAYRTGKALPNGYKVVGWAHIRATDSHTFTLAKATDTFVAEVIADGPRSKVKVWGAAYKYRPMRKPLSTIPRRYVPTSTNSIVR